MPIYDTFTKRKRRAERAGKPEVYRYDSLPKELRVQVLYILLGTLGQYREMGQFDLLHSPPPSNERWEAIQDIIVREKGTFSLSGKAENAFKQCAHQLLEGGTDDALEVIEVSFALIDRVVRNTYNRQRAQEGLKIISPHIHFT